MRVLAAMTFGLSLFASGAWAQTTQVQLDYDTYAAGVQVMQMHVSFGLGPWNYQIGLNYHTTGLVGLLFRGHQVNTVRGTWLNGQAEPVEFFGEGVWRGRERRTLIDYDRGQPLVRDLQPPQETEREPIPPDMRQNTKDTLSALAQLMRQVQQSHSCETTARTYDGRRVLEVVAHTGGPEQLETTGRSIYGGAALRCDFEGQALAGFLIGDNDPEHRRPLRGSAWLAPLTPGTAPLPVRIAFQTRWFGVATMYLAGAAATPSATDTTRARTE